MYKHHSSIIAKEGEQISTDFHKNERLYQSQETFKLSKWLIEAGIFLTLTNILLLFSGHISVTVAKTTGGLTYAVILCGRKLGKDANDRLDESTKVSKYEDNKGKG